MVELVFVKAFDNTFVFYDYESKKYLVVSNQDLFLFEKYNTTCGIVYIMKTLKEINAYFRFPDRAMRKKDYFYESVKILNCLVKAINNGEVKI